MADPQYPFETTTASSDSTLIEGMDGFGDELERGRLGRKLNRSTLHERNKLEELHVVCAQHAYGGPDGLRHARISATALASAVCSARTSLPSVTRSKPRSRIERA